MAVKSGFSLAQKKKVASASAVCLQVRRISCKLCDQPYTYLVRETPEVQRSAAPVFDGDYDRLEDIVEGQFKGRLREIAQSKDAGFAPCPHCRRYQPWMISAQFKDWALALSIILFALSIGGMFAAHYVGKVNASWPMWVGIAAVGSIVLAVAAAFILTPRSGSDNQLVWSKTDEAFETLANRHDGQFQDILISWGNATGKKIPQNVILLGMEDLTGEGLFGEECSYRTLFIGTRSFKKKKKKKRRRAE